MQTIQITPNKPLAPKLDELPLEAVTVIDGRGMSPQFAEMDGALCKGPGKLVHSEASRQAISCAQQQRGKAGIMGKQWS